jgi:hypothetical protein
LLLKASGCIAVSGGLEVASDRLLELINKGITVAQVAKVCKNFTDSGIMVHAYLMYGFPTQTAQETIDSLEMVRQLFELGILQSAFWHLFTMTAHSPIGLNPEKFSVKKRAATLISFANNDIEHIDLNGTDHEIFGYGLKKALLNYMHASCFDFPLYQWFDFKVPKTNVAPDFIRKSVEDAVLSHSINSKVIWLGKLPKNEIIQKSKKGNKWEVMSLSFVSTSKEMTITIEPSKGQWLLNMLPKLSIYHNKQQSLQFIKDDYASAGLEDFELFWDNKPMNTLNKVGLLSV